MAAPKSPFGFPLIYCPGCETVPRLPPGFFPFPLLCVSCQMTADAAMRAGHPVIAANGRLAVAGADCAEGAD